MEKHVLFAQRVGLVAITNLLVSVSGLILLPILTKNISTAEYGSWSLILVTTSLVPNLVGFGLQFSLVRFLPAAKDQRERQELFYSIGFFTFFAGLGAAGLFLLFSKQIAVIFFNRDLSLALIFPLIILLACLSAFLPGYFQALQQMRKYSILSLLQAYLNVSLIAYFVYVGYGLEGAVIGLLIQQLTVFFVSVLLILRDIGFALPKFKNMRMYLRFGLPLVLSSFSSWIVNSSDRYLIGLILGTVAVGYYSPAYALGSAIGLLSAPFGTMLMPVLSKHYDAKRFDDVRVIMKYSLKYYLAIAIPSFFAVSILSKQLLLVLSTQEIAINGYLVTPFVAAAMLLTGAYEVFLQVIALKLKTALAGSIWVISAAVNFGLNLILIPYLGIIGAALTTLLAFACAFVFTTAYSLKNFAFDVSGTFILKSICASLAMSALLFAWSPVGLLNILLSIGISAVIYLSILLVLRGLTVSEIKFFCTVLKGSGA
jgi:O-antigen/teichoic acid export membrane protein